MPRRPATFLVCFAVAKGALGGCTDPEQPSASAENNFDRDSTAPAGPGRGAEGRPEDPADTTPRVRYVGRVDTSSSEGPRLAWGGTRVIVRFRGPALKVKLAEQSANEGPSRYAVFVDGVPREEMFAPNDGEGEYELASGLSAGEPHVVELYRRTEPMVGITQVLGFEYPDGELLAPPPWPDRRIEFLGDSESTGYGIDCADRSEPFTGLTQDERKTFPSMVGRAVGAETHNVSFSGKGVLRNEGDQPVVFEEFYAHAIPLVPKPASWDFGTWRPDVVWVGLGANDWDLGGIADRPPPDEAAFRDKYRALVMLVREKNPTAHIVCAVEGIVNDDYPPGYSAYSSLKRILGQIVDERRAANDTKVHLYDMPRAREADLTACAWHPNAAWHEKAAGSVAAKVREITGWN